MKPRNWLIAIKTSFITPGLPYLAAFLASFSVLIVVEILDREETQRFQQNTRSTVLNQLSTVRSRLEGELNQRLFVEKGLVAYISALNSNITQAEFEKLSQVLVAQQSGIRGIALYKDNTVSHMFPLEGNESAIGFSPMSIPEERMAIVRAIDSRKTVIAGPINLVPEGIAFISRTPIFLTPRGEPPQSGSYWGMVGIILDRDALFQDAGLLDPKLGLRYGLRGKDGLGSTGPIFYGDAGVLQQNPVILSVTLPNGSWQIAAVPEAGWPTKAPISQWLGVGGALLALIAGILAYILVRWPTRLQKAVDNATLALRQSKAELKTANAELKHLDQLKDEFLANTSHELRTPLNGMIGLAESLIDGAAGPLSALQEYNLQLIVQSGCRLATLINDILDFSKLKNKAIELQLMPVKIADFIEVIFAMSQPLIGPKNLELINQIPPELPAVLADGNRLQQILYNLIGNAIKFTEAGFVKVSAQLITHEATTHPQHLAITISDTGIGIPEDKLDRIFKSFEQADGSTARIYGGTGLGLAITKQLVELHNGTITVISTPGAGSHFTFTLPIVTNQTNLEPQASIFKAAPLSTITSQKLEIVTPSSTDNDLNLESQITSQYKILIVDDEPINLQVLSNYLSLANYQIEKAGNGLEALKIIEQGFQPDLILLDVMMPHMTGYEVTQKLRETWPMSELPIMMITAKNTVSDLVFGLEVGANDYLGKPFIKEELMARIRTHLKIKKKE